MLVIYFSLIVWLYIMNLFLFSNVLKYFAWLMEALYVQSSLNDKHIVKSGFAHLTLIGFLNLFLV